MPNLLTAIEKIVGPRGVILGDDLRARAASTLDPSANQALALIRPESSEELSAVMKLCHDQKQPIVIQGGMTGLVEGGTAQKGELAISLERMNKIQGIDLAGQTMTVEAGATIQAVQENALSHDLLFPVDWGARGTAMVGGAIATNAGGNTVVRYGMMRDQVLGLEVVLADGTILSSMNALLKNNTGYDLKQLFIGSEGTLGIVTKAVLRLRADLKFKQTALIAVETFDGIIDVFSRLQTGLSGALSAFEVMWKDHYEMIVTEGGHQWILPKGYPYYAVVEASGANDDADAEQFQSLLGEAMEADLIVDAVICGSDSQRDSVWAIREDVDTFLRVLHPPIPFDVSVPISNMERYVDNVCQDMREQMPNAKGTVFGHLGDNNIHFCWTAGSDDPAEKAKVSKIVYKNLERFNGSVSAEHGIGLSKRDYLKFSRNAVELEWMARLKALFDPENLLNPGRVIDIRENS